MSERSSRLRTALLSANSQSADYSEAQARHSWINQQLDASGATPLIDIEIASAGNLRGYLLGNDKLRAMMSDPEAGIEADPHFPRRLVREDPYFALKDGVLKNNAWEPFAIWDAESGESLSWHHKAAVFLFTLTLFAIALYSVSYTHLCGFTSCWLRILHSVPCARLARQACPATGPCSRAWRASSRVVHNSCG